DATEKVVRFGHDRLKTFGVGVETDAKTWQAVLHQLVAQGMLEPDPDAFGGLRLTEAARPVLRGEQALRLRKPRTAPARGGRKSGRVSGLPEQVPPADAALWEALRACRLTLAREQNLPPYVIFHDTTLLEMLRARPASLSAMSTLPGIGRRKLERYGEAFLDVLRAHAA
ncbi:MAG: HRDC domain-containing protein, partial [Alphaproteobacteria bacterium]